MKAIFLILLVLSLFAFSYSVLKTGDCKTKYLVDLNYCDYGSKFASVFNETVAHAGLEGCKKRAQEKLEQCLKNEKNNLNK